MKKIMFFLLLFSALLLGQAENVYADTTEDITVENVDETVEDSTDESMEEYPQLTELIEAVTKTNRKLDAAVTQLEYMVALSLILVVFETFRIVRSWSKNVGLK